jgi:hypothetical protein
MSGAQDASSPLLTDSSMRRACCRSAFRPVSTHVLISNVTYEQPELQHFQALQNVTHAFEEVISTLTIGDRDNPTWQIPDRLVALQT